MNKAYRIAIIGVGGIADIHATCVTKDLPEAELIGGSCRTEEKGKNFATKYNCAWYADYEVMLDDLEPDVVLITTPSGAHLEAVHACARRGIHVLCEKPLEITTERTDQMLEYAKTSGVHLGGVFQMRYSPLLQSVRKTISTGRFGDLSAISAQVPWWRDNAYYAPERWQGTKALDGGGALMNQSIHVVDTMQWLAAAFMPDLDPDTNPVTEVFAYTGQRGHGEDVIEVEDTAIVSLRFQNGGFGQILAATSMFPGSNRRLLVAGRDGTVQMEEDHLIQYSFREEMDGDQAVREQFSAAAERGGASDPLAIDRSGHEANIREFLKSIGDGNPSGIDGSEARKAVAIVEAAYWSAESGAPVAVG
jgi:predicted dehydrogenase